MLLAGLDISGPNLCTTERGTVLVRGTVVTDPEALSPHSACQPGKLLSK